MSLALLEHTAHQGWVDIMIIVTVYKTFLIILLDTIFRLLDNVANMAGISMLT